MSLTEAYDFHGKTALITQRYGGLPATPIGFAVASGEQFARCLSSAGASRYVTRSSLTIDGGISWGGKSW